MTTIQVFADHQGRAGAGSGGRQQGRVDVHNPSAREVAPLAPRPRVPRLVSLPQLLRASDELADGDDHVDAVKQLLNTGTTGLGGARPTTCATMASRPSRVLGRSVPPST